MAGRGELTETAWPIIAPLVTRYEKGASNYRAMIILAPIIVGSGAFRQRR